MNHPVPLCQPHHPACLSLPHALLTALNQLASIAGVLVQIKVDRGKDRLVEMVVCVPSPDSRKKRLNGGGLMLLRNYRLPGVCILIWR